MTTIGRNISTARISWNFLRGPLVPEFSSVRSRVKAFVTSFALICVLSAFVGIADGADEKEKAASDAATPWLALVDTGQ